MQRNFLRAFNLRALHEFGYRRLLHRYIEEIVDESWTEHLPRFDRVTEGDVALRERKLAFHLGETAPHVMRRVIDIVMARVILLPRSFLTATACHLGGGVVLFAGEPARS